MADGTGGERVMQIRSFRNCFTVERRIHKLDRWRVPLPYGLPVRGLAYFVVASVTLLVLSRLPLFGVVLNEFNTFTRLVLIPGAIAFVLYRVTLDGRPSHAAAVAWIRMHTEPGRMSGFRRLDTPERVTLGTVLLAPDERSARMRAGVIEGPAEVVLRYAAEAEPRRRELRVRQSGHEPLWRGKRVRLGAGQRVVVG
jgi:hypothetical protein